MHPALHNSDERLRQPESHASAAAASGDRQREDHHSVVREDLQAICDRLNPLLDRLQNRRILITGGGGFLGYYLVQTLLHWNSSRDPGARTHITVFDNYVRGVPPWLERFATRTDLAIVKHDVTRPVPANQSFDYIVHAASIASPTFYRQFPLETMDTNVNGLRTLLEYAHARGQADRPIEGFLFFSTSEIYGDPPPEQIPTAETFRGHVSCTGPRACYDESKRYGETLCVTFASRYGIPVKVVRPFNNYGPGLALHDRRVIPDFARNILAGEDIVLLSDGSPTRTFCYVADAVVGYYQVLLAGRTAEAYNIGAEAPEVSVRELAERLVSAARSVSGYAGQVVRGVDPDLQYLVDNPQRRCPSIQKAKNEVGFSTAVGLDEGLRRTLIWYAGAR
jgi:UDP-glucuronate decarboxylase